ncbi:hypothetical protein FJT64_006119 [Amphibalanus amphitrite]|uniref:FZ domain-containing protein n=1 Tax=Amphibalanus amphitrite TaxID=1232801 RepID=A0A6A4W333_AMPAM|nr:hypothetical protein FJT64_006119 [Amphibalanus amphitrite]
MEAYHDWLCAMYVPFCGSEGRRLRPCRSHCQRVQRVCPFFLPSERKSAATQYAGEPAFFCDDPDIPDIPPFTTGSTYGDPDCCYDSCCVRPDQPECSADTCSAAAACPGQAGPPPPPPPAAPASAGAWAVRFNQLQRHSPAAKIQSGLVWAQSGSGMFLIQISFGFCMDSVTVGSGYCLGPIRIWPESSQDLI